MANSRFTVGIDLGTTNCALAYFDTMGDSEKTSKIFLIPQIIQPRVCEERKLLPSFLYLPTKGELQPGILNLPLARKNQSQLESLHNPTVHLFQLIWLVPQNLGYATAV